MYRKILAVIASCAFALTGCSADYSHIEGYNDVMKARELYAELNAAVLTVKDETTDTVTQELTFLYDPNGTLQYMYFGTDGEKDYYEYHNGADYSYYEDGEWKTVAQDNENYVVYTKTNKMSMTAAGMIFIKPESVTASSVTSSDGRKIIEMIYDASSLNSSMSSQLNLVGNLTEFKVICTINADGYCEKLEQIGTAELEGKKSNIHYSLTVECMNDVGDVYRTEVGADNTVSAEN